FFHHVGRLDDVEVEAPEGVVVVGDADAGVGDAVEAEASGDAPVRVEEPLHDVAVPARHHLRDQAERAVARVVDGDAGEVAAVLPALHDRLRRLGTPAEAGGAGDAPPDRLEAALGVQPVPVRPAHVPIVADVEDRDVRLLQYQLAAV